MRSGANPLVTKAILISLSTVAICIATPVEAGKLADEVALLQYEAQPTDAQAKVKAYFDGVLKDPSSAIYRFGDIYTGWCKAGVFQKRKIAWNGWAMNVAVNAKNSYGGYTGEEAYTVFFSNGQPFRDAKGADFGFYGQGSWAASAICTKVAIGTSTAIIPPETPQLGIGVKSVPEGGYVAMVVPESAAAKAGIVAGMVFSNVNGISVRGMDMETITKILLAASGSVTLTVIGKGDVMITKAAIGH